MTGSTEVAINAAQEANSDVQGEPPAVLGDTDSPATLGTVEVTAVLKKILVVDDELIGLSRSQLDETALQTLEDTTSEEYESLLEIARLREGFDSVEAAGPDAVREFFGGDGVTEVILSKEFQQHASEGLKALLKHFSDDVARIRTLRRQIEDAFPATEYELLFLGSNRPSIDEFLNCSLLLLDLVLKPANDPVDAAVTYLTKLSTDAGDRILPPIILMSSHDELKTHQLIFAAKSRISAAGLIALRKPEIARSEFGAAGLRLTYQQLQTQNDVAHRMRSFMRAWVCALDMARKNSEQTLWNLDAAAMQQIHHTAFADNDPYDEHLNELIAREYLWHVEADPAVGEAIEALDACFLEHFDKTQTAVLKNRFVAPFFEPTHFRTLISRFTWTGWQLPANFVEFPPSIRQINKLLPFGAVLADTANVLGKDCLIHITQQCDLNSISRMPEDAKTLTFAVARPVEVLLSRAPVHAGDTLAARGININGREYDLALVPGHMLALPVNEFLSFASSSNLRMCGRLRHDVAAQFLQAAANNLTRPAAQKIFRAGIVEAKISLHGSKLNGPKGKKFLVLAEPDDSARSLEVTTLEKKIYSFQDGACFEIALWIKREIEAAYAPIKIDEDILCNALLVGVADGKNILPQLLFKVHATELAKAPEVMKGINQTGEVVQLAIFTDSEKPRS